MCKNFLIQNLLTGTELGRESESYDMRLETETVQNQRFHMSSRKKADRAVTERRNKSELRHSDSFSPLNHRLIGA